MKDSTSSTKVLTCVSPVRAGIECTETTCCLRTWRVPRVSGDCRLQNDWSLGGHMCAPCERGLQVFAGVKSCLLKVSPA